MELQLCKMLLFRKYFALKNTLKRNKPLTKATLKMKPVNFALRRYFCIIPLKSPEF